MKCLFKPLVSLLLIFQGQNGILANIVPFFSPKEEFGSVRVSEGLTTIGKPVYKFVGVDKDGDALTFSLREIRPQGHGTFRLERVSNTESNLVLTRTLDRETVSDYLYDIELTDGKSSKPAVQTFMVVVEDENDNSPIFKQHNSTIIVPERNPAPKLIATLIAEDADEGPNGRVSYTLETDSDDKKTFNLTLGPNREALIFALKTFDFEKKSKYNIRVIAQDSPLDNKRKVTKAEITIRVSDWVDNGPSFVSTKGFTQIREDIPLNSEVCQVNAVDSDPTEGIIYKLLNENDKFSIDSDTGVVKTKMKYSYEPSSIHGNYTLRVRASETAVRKKRFPKPGEVLKTFIDTTVVIEVVNVDEPPKFKNTTYLGTVPENSPSGYPIQLFTGYKAEVIDNDLLGKELITMSIDGEGGTFEVFPSKSYSPFMFQIVVKDPLRLDYERLQEIMFHLIATDTSGNRTVLMCSVFINDTNDNVPVFGNSTYQVKIPENPAVGQEIVQLKVTDKDSGSYGTKGLRYSIMPGLGSNELEINQTSGQVVVVPPDANYSTVFDREQHSQVYVMVEACDNLGNYPRNCISGLVIIELEDENDNAPEFLQSFFETSLFEGINNEMIPLRILTHDADQPGTPNSDIHVSVSPTYPANKIELTVDPNTSLLRAPESFDFEKLSIALPNLTFLSPSGVMCITLNYTIQASDLGTPSLSSHANLSLTIMDTNDCEPKFSRNYYELLLPENIEGGFDILQVKAIDEDITPIFNKVTYKFFNEEVELRKIFWLDPDTGVLSIPTGNKLNFASRPNYIFQIGAIDGLGLKSLKNCLVNITIKDVNDMPPVFYQDNPEEERIQYAHHRAALYRVEIFEAYPPDVLVKHVKAFDPDSNAELRYTIQFNETRAYKRGSRVLKVDLTKYFYINNITGEIKTGLIPFEYVRIDQVRVLVIVEDIASETGIQRDYAELTLDITNVPNWPPHFLQEHYETAIMENVENGTIVVRVEAVDDKGEYEKIRYSLRVSNLKLFPFVVDPATGIISVHGSVDLRMLPQWINFTAVAVNIASSFNLSSIVPVSIKVQGENFHAPVFQSTPSTFTIKENSPLGTVVGEVKATDPDAGRYGSIKYFLDHQLSAEGFHICEDNGTITVTKNLDREKREFNSLLIYAVDNFNDKLERTSHTVSKNFTVILEDENDERPLIHVSPFMNRIVHTIAPDVYSISERLNNQSILNISVTDGDEAGTNNSAVLVTLSLDHQNKPIFYLVQRENLSIATKGTLLGLAGNYSLAIKATDLGEPPNTVTKTVYIVVKNGSLHFRNEGASPFTSTLFVGIISASHQTGRSIVQVHLAPEFEESNSTFYIASSVKVHLRVKNENDSKTLKQNKKQMNSTLSNSETSPNMNDTEMRLNTSNKEISYSFNDTKIKSNLNDTKKSKNLSLRKNSSDRNEYQKLFLIDPVNGTIVLNFNATIREPAYYSFKVSLQNEYGDNIVDGKLPQVKIFYVAEDEKVYLFSKLTADVARKSAGGLKSSLESIFGLIVGMDADIDYCNVIGTRCVEEMEKLLKLPRVFAMEEILSVFQVSVISLVTNKPLDKHLLKKAFEENQDEIAKVFQKFKILNTLNKAQGNDPIVPEITPLHFYYVLFSSLALMVLVTVILLGVCLRVIRKRRKSSSEELVECSDIIATNAVTSNLAREMKLTLEEFDHTDPVESEC